MKRKTITITDNGKVTVPSETRMSIAEIADLFGIYYQTAKRHIRAIEKSGVADGDYLMSCTCDGSKIRPDYYGLEMIIALSFRVQSAKADVFRDWILRKVSKAEIVKTPKMLILSMKNTSLN